MIIDNKQKNAGTAGPSGSRQRAWRWTIGWWRSCTPRHRPVGAEAPRSLLEIDVFPGGKFPCPQTSCRMRLRSAFVPGGTMGHGVPLTKPPDQCTSISVSAPWFQWVNIPKDEMLMKLTSQAATLLWRLKKIDPCRSSRSRPHKKYFKNCPSYAVRCPNVPSFGLRTHCSGFRMWNKKGFGVRSRCSQKIKTWLLSLTKTKKGKQLCFSISIVGILIHVFGKQTIKFHVLLIDLGCRTLHDPALGCLSLKAVTVVNPKWDEFCRKIEATTVISTEWGDSWIK